MEIQTEANWTTSYEKLLKLKWRRAHLENTIKKDRETKFGGFTNLRLGPPRELAKEEAQEWGRIMKESWKKCTSQLLFPHMISKEEKIEEKLAMRANSIDTEEEYAIFREGIKRGLEHAKKKYLEKYRDKTIDIPEPPKRKGVVIKQIINQSFIQRGEKWTVEKNGFVRNIRIKERDNIFRILAHALYNNTRMHRVVIRKFWEYLEEYEQVEKTKFRPFLGNLSNGTRKYIEGWKMYVNSIKNRDLKITGYELEVIARLYCVQIRIMHEDKKWVSSYGIREEYSCVWKTGADGERVINLLELENGTWALLEGIELNNQIEREGDVFTQITNEEEGTESIGHIVEEQGALDNQRQIREYEWGNPINEIEYAITREEQIYYKSREEIEKSIEPNKALTNLVEEEETQIIVEKKREGVVDEDNTQKEDIESITTTESIKALFYEEKDDRIEEREPNRSDNEDLDIDRLESSCMSRMTMKSIDTVENSIIHMREKINSLKIGRKHQLAGKLALKNVLWQRSRILERNRRRNLAKKREKQDKKEGNKIRSMESIFDFTSKNLDTYEIELLSKGESFSIANNKINMDRLKVDLYNYTRRLKLKDIAENQYDIRDEDKNTQGLSQFSRITRSQTNTQTSQRRISSTPDIIKQNQSKRDSILRSRSPSILEEHIEKKINQGRRSNSQLSRITSSQASTQNSQRKISSTSSITVRNLDSKKDNIQSSRSSSIQRGRIAEGRNQSRRSSSTNLKNKAEEKEDTRQIEGINDNNEAYDNKCKIRKLPCTYDPVSENRNLLRYNNCIQEEGLVAIRKKTKFKDNITTKLREAYESLKKRVTNKEIIITKADKGGGIVILDYDLYIKKGTEYIEVESLAYEKTEIDQKDIITKITKERNKIVNKLKKEKVIQEQTATYCTHQVEEKITGMKFYYKVHKDNNIHTMPLRPLQSCIAGPTHHLSQVLTDLLQPLLKVENIPTFIQDSNQLLVRLSKLPKLGEKDTIITSDVAALYPSIPHREGLEAMKQFLKDFSYFNKTQIDTIINALELVITKNYVKWNGCIYEQIKGVAMGTPVAVAYANIFMHWIDTEIKKKATYIIEHIRYIDDNLFIIPEEKIAETIEIANSILSPSIRYTYETLDKQGEKGLPFLDTQLFISEDFKIESRLYTKKTDKHTYLLPSSYHPIHITKNIPLATFLRIRRLCSKDEWFQADVMQAIEWLEDRDYKYNDITRAIGIAIGKDRWELINNIESQRGKRKDKDVEKGIDTIPLIVTYSQRTLQLRTVLKQRQDILDASFNNSKVIPRISFRRQDNLGDLLVQKSLRGPIVGEELRVCKFVECGIQQKYRTQCPCKGTHDQKKCRCCVHASFELTGIKVKIHKEVTCDSRNLVYMISCKICKKRYVGETQQKLRDRLMQHMNNIQKLSQPLYIHFKNVHKPTELTISVLETIRGIEPFMRKVREAWWINHLQTLEPKGFNVKLECNQVYIEDRKIKNRKPDKR